MAQFDSLIISSLVWSLTLLLIIYYFVTIEVLIPDFFGSKKFREKKFSLPVFYGNLKQGFDTIIRLFSPVF